MTQRDDFSWCGGRRTRAADGGRCRVEAGESDAEAVAREMLEETGLVVRPGALIGSVERPAATGTYLIFDYACEVIGGRLRPGDDADDAAWVDAATFTELDRTDALSPQLADTLRSWQVLPL